MISSSASTLSFNATGKIFSNESLTSIFNAGCQTGKLGETGCKLAVEALSDLNRSCGAKFDRICIDSESLFMCLSQNIKHEALS
jgi:hypothetical protein